MVRSTVSWTVVSTAAPISGNSTVSAPEPLRILAEGPHLSATITARVTEHGIEETISVTVDVIDAVAGDSLDAGIARLTDALGDIAQRSLPTFALVVAREGEADRCVCAVTYPPPNPVALLIGAPSVRRLGLDLAALPTGDITKVVGRPTLPAFVVPLGDARTPGWDALHQTLEAVGPERLATLVSSPLLQAWEEDLHEFDLLNESAVEGAGAETLFEDHETPETPETPEASETPEAPDSSGDDPADDGDAKEGRGGAS
jgi:hypothetical protein